MEKTRVLNPNRVPEANNQWCGCMHWLTGASQNISIFMICDAWHILLHQYIFATIVNHCRQCRHTLLIFHKNAQIQKEFRESKPLSIRQAISRNIFANAIFYSRRRKIKHLLNKKLYINTKVNNVASTIFISTSNFNLFFNNHNSPKNTFLFYILLFYIY